MKSISGTTLDTRDFDEDIAVVSAKDVVNDSGVEIDLSTIEEKIDSLAQGKKTVFVDLAGSLEDSSIVPKGVGEAKYVPERDAIFATCDRLDCRPPNKPFRTKMNRVGELRIRKRSFRKM